MNAQAGEALERWFSTLLRSVHLGIEKSTSCGWISMELGRVDWACNGKEGRRVYAKAHVFIWYTTTIVLRCLCKLYMAFSRKR